MVELAGVELTSVSRHDVSAGTRPGGAVRSEDGAVARQPPVWTFVDFAGPDDVAEAAAEALAPPSSARVAGTRTSTSVTTRSWCLPIGSSGTDAASESVATRRWSTADASVCRSTSSTGSSRRSRFTCRRHRNRRSGYTPSSARSALAPISVVATHNRAHGRRWRAAQVGGEAERYRARNRGGRTPSRKPRTSVDVAHLEFRGPGLQVVCLATVRDVLFARRAAIPRPSS